MGDWSCWEAAVWDEYLLHRRLESPEVLGSQGLRGEAMGAVMGAQEPVSCARAPEGWGRLGLPGCSARTVPGPQE